MTVKEEDVCPDDQIDPSLPGFKEMHVEKTLTIMRGLKPLKKQRLWLFYRATEEEIQMTDDEMEARVRAQFKLYQPNAKIEHRMDEWAIWSGPGEPTEPAFELEEAESEERKLAGNSWYYSSLHTTEEAIRKAFRTRDDAPVSKNASGSIAAVWIGDGPPLKEAFPKYNPHVELEGFRGIIHKLKKRVLLFIKKKIEE